MAPTYQTKKKVYALVIDIESVDRLRAVFDMYNEPSEDIIGRLISETKQAKVLDHFIIKKIV